MEGALAAPVGMTGRKALENTLRGDRGLLSQAVAGEVLYCSAHMTSEETALNAHCLFCSTLRRDDLAETIRQLLGMEVVVPKIVQRKWIRGKATEAIRDYLPGYLFLYADAPIEDLVPLFGMADVYRVPGDRDNSYRLAGADLAFARMLRDCSGTIRVLKTRREGGRVRLADGAMGSAGGQVVRVDRRGRAFVRFGFDGAAVQSRVAIEMIEDGTSVQAVRGEADSETALGKKQREMLHGFRVPAGRAPYSLPAASQGNSTWRSTGGPHIHGSGTMAVQKRRIGSWDMVSYKGMSCFANQW